jgi:methionyl-tRNA formyltransferase
MKMRVVYMGTPEFAVPPLQSILNAGHEVAGVFTRADKPQGRKMLLTPPPVKVLAESEHIPVFQPASLKDGRAASILERLQPDVVVVAAYGMLLPKAVLSIPRFGCINIHASLLPKYRGAAPIQAAVLNGEAKTGVTAMQMSEGLDTGDILFQESTPIGTSENTKDLSARLSRLGAGLIVRTLDALRDGTVHPIPQDDSQSCYAPKITKKMSPVDWTRSAEEIHNQVRALYPWPAACTLFRSRHLKICRSRTAGKQYGTPGLAVSENGSFLVCCGDGSALELMGVQLEGGRRMSGSDFLRGHSIEGIVFPDKMEG